MPQFETVLFDVQDRVATITLNRPERGNAMNQKLKDELRECWRLVKDEPDILVAILTGAGKAFQTGADVEGLADKGFVRVGPWRELARIEGIREQPTPRRQLVYKPVITAVNGVCNGFGLDLVTEADIPIASDKAYFMDSHVSVGLVSSHEMVNLARRVPVAVAMRMALMGRHERMSAQRAYEVGLVTEVVPHDQLMTRAREIADVLLQNAPIAMYGTKMGLLQGLGLPIPQAEEISAGYLSVNEKSEDFHEGPRSFMEKRKPEWKGR
jgi:enoyl-CoA hydratase/carnithine racemase